MAELAGCWQGCLNTAGHGGIAKGRATFSANGIELPDNAIQRARIARTRFFIEDRDAFMRQLIKEIRTLTARAYSAGLRLAVRLNGTSDIRFEQIGIQWPITQLNYAHIFELFPDVQFYDYTKIPNRDITGIKNYHLTLSYSKASTRYAEMIKRAADEQGRNLAVVFRKAPLPDKLKLWGWKDARRVVDGDAHDLRFLDPPGVVVGLKAKGHAKWDTSGFVL